MSLIKIPAKGMNDFLPEDMELRNYLINEIKTTYKSFGYDEIETPIVEHIENLMANQGGDNEKLIYKILKRGDKLNLQGNVNENDIVDYGLRYDLTLPLSRFYSNYNSILSNPFKAMQIGYSFRAERPQKGRYRSFMQCDIDILNNKTNYAEIDLLTATATLLSKFFDKFTIKINDREILKSMASYAGFNEEDFNDVFIIVDKISKIGLDGIKNELLSRGYDEFVVNKYITLFNSDYNEICNLDAFKNVNEIVDFIEKLNIPGCNIIIDKTLVRGQSYYTKTIFEIEIDDTYGSIAGGGRYDKLIEKFSGMDVPACGISIGFERLFSILKERNYKIKKDTQKLAILYEKNCNIHDMHLIFEEANELRKEGKIVLILERKKNVRYQKESLLNNGFIIYKEIFKNNGEEYEEII